MHADSFLHSVASPFYSFVTTIGCMWESSDGWLVERTFMRVLDGEDRVRPATSRNKNNDEPSKRQLQAFRHIADVT